MGYRQLEDEPIYECEYCGVGGNEVPEAKFQSGIEFKCRICGEKCVTKQMEHEERIAELEAGYAEAIEDIADWACYADEYFQRKHDLAGTLAKHKAVLAGQGGESHD